MNLATFQPWRASPANIIWVSCNTISPFFLSITQYIYRKELTRSAGAKYWMISILLSIYHMTEILRLPWRDFTKGRGNGIPPSIAFHSPLSFSSVYQLGFYASRIHQLSSRGAMGTWSAQEGICVHTLCGGTLRPHSIFICSIQPLLLWGKSVYKTKGHHLPFLLPIVSLCFPLLLLNFHAIAL